ncbi:hypothetical protein VIGAN_08090000, partial [Vigna angularis var. angularis]
NRGWSEGGIYSLLPWPCASSSNSSCYVLIWVSHELHLSKLDLLHMLLEWSCCYGRGLLLHSRLQLLVCWTSLLCFQTIILVKSVKLTSRCCWILSEVLFFIPKHCAWGKPDEGLSHDLV